MQQHTDKHGGLLPFDIIVEICNAENGKESRTDTRNELWHKDVNHWTCLAIMLMVDKVQIDNFETQSSFTDWLVYGTLFIRIGCGHYGLGCRRTNIQITRHYQYNIQSDSIRINSNDDYIATNQHMKHSDRSHLFWSDRLTVSDRSELAINEVRDDDEEWSDARENDTNSGQSGSVPVPAEIRHHERQQDLTDLVARQQNTFFGLVKLCDLFLYDINCLSVSYITSRLAFQFKLFFERRQSSDGVTEEHGLKEAKETVGEQVRFLCSESLEPFAFERPNSAPSVFILVHFVLFTLAHNSSGRWLLDEWAKVGGLCAQLD